MSLRERLAGGGPLLIAALAAAMLTLGGARLLAAGAADRAQAAPILALGLRSLLWAGLGAWLWVRPVGVGPAPRRALAMTQDSATMAIPWRASRGDRGWRGTGAARPAEGFPPTLWRNTAETASRPSDPHAERPARPTRLSPADTRAKPCALPLALACGLGTGLFSALFLRLVAAGVPCEAPLMPTPAGLASPWLAILAVAAVLVAPLGEELLFRGALLDGLARLHGERIGLLGSSAAFALVHLSPVHLVTAFVAGLALGWLRLRTNRLWPCVLAHALHNALWLVMGLL